MAAIPLDTPRIDPTPRPALTRPDGARPLTASCHEWLVWREGESRARLILAYLRRTARAG